VTSLQIFAFFGIPILVAAFALLVYFLEGRPRRVREPDLFHRKSIRTPGE
jgi:hypothetical protein